MYLNRVILSENGIGDRTPKDADGAARRNDSDDEERRHKTVRTETAYRVSFQQVVKYVHRCLPDGHAER